MSVLMDIVETSQRRADAMKRTIRACRHGTMPNGAPGLESIPSDVLGAGVTKAFYEGYEVLVRAKQSSSDQATPACPSPALSTHPSATARTSFYSSAVVWSMPWTSLCTRPGLSRHLPWATARGITGK